MAVSIASVCYTIVGVVLVQKIFLALYKYINTMIVARQVPSLPGTRLIQGDFWFESFGEYIDKSLRFVQSSGAKMHTFWIYFFYPVYCMNHPDTAKVILTASVPKDDGLTSVYSMLKPWIGDGLIVSIGGNKWERNRHLLTPAFHFDILKTYVDKFNIVAEDMLIRLSQCRDTSVEICQAVSLCTLDALLQCAFSYDGQVQKLRQDHPYVSAVHELSMMSVKRWDNPLLYPEFTFFRTKTGKRFQSLCDYVHAFSEDIIKSRRKALLTSSETTETRRKDFLDIILMARDDNGHGLTDTEIRAEVDTFLFAGHDTTSSAISWGIYALAKYPDIQEEIYKEILDVVGTEQVEQQHLSKLKFLLSFIKEVLRMYNVVPVIDRVLRKPLTIDGVTLPSGSAVSINIYAINHNPAVWPDHQVFRPDRFSESAPEREAFSFIPFSAGSRNCIGQNFALNEQKVILTRLIQTFRIELDTAHEVVRQPLLVMKAKDGIKVFLHSR